MVITAPTACTAVKDSPTKAADEIVPKTGTENIATVAVPGPTARSPRWNKTYAIAVGPIARKIRFAHVEVGTPDQSVEGSAGSASNASARGREQVHELARDPGPGQVAAADADEEHRRSGDAEHQPGRARDPEVAPGEPAGADEQVEVGNGRDSRMSPGLRAPASRILVRF